MCWTHGQREWSLGKLPGTRSRLILKEVWEAKKYVHLDGANLFGGVGVENSFIDSSEIEHCFLGSFGLNIYIF